MISFVWGSGFNTSPGSNLSKSLIDDQIRLTSRGIRERMEVEHLFGPNHDIDDGGHVPGGTSVCAKGTAAERDVLVDPRTGSIFLVSDGPTFAMYVYLGAVLGWVAAGGVTHDALTGRGDNDHPHCLLKSGGAISGNFNLNGNLLLTPEASEETYGGYALFRHAGEDHSSLGSPTAIKNGQVSLDKFRTSQSSATSALNNGSYVGIDWDDSVFMFFPQVYVLTATFDRKIRFLPGVGGNRLIIFNESGSNYDVRVRKEWIY